MIAKPARILLYCKLLLLLLNLCNAGIMRHVREEGSTTTSTEIPMITSSEKGFLETTTVTTLLSTTMEDAEEQSHNNSQINATSQPTTISSDMKTTTTFYEDFSTTTKMSFDSINKNDELWSVTTETSDSNLQTSTEYPETTTDENQTTYPTLLEVNKKNKTISNRSSNSTKPSTSTSEKKAKFMQDNSNISNLTLPDNADVWTLVGMKENPMKVEPTKINLISNSDKLTSSMEDQEEEEVLGTKNLSDWSKIMINGEVGVFNETDSDTAVTDASTTKEPIESDTESNLILETTTKENNLINEEVLLKPLEKSSDSDHVEVTTKKYEIASTTTLKATTATLTTSTTTSTKAPPSPPTTLSYPTSTPPSSDNSKATETNQLDLELLPKENTSEVIEVSTISVKNITEVKFDNVYNSHSNSESTTTNLNLFMYNVGNISARNNNNNNIPESNNKTDSTIVTSKSDYDSSNSNVIIAVSVSVSCILVAAFVIGFIYVIRKRQKQTTYGQRCRPVGLDAYSLDNVSVCNSIRRKGGSILRQSKRMYGNAAFDDPSLKHNILRAQDIRKFSERRSTIYEEFKDVPQIIARSDEVPTGCEDRNRYANVIPLPETRVLLTKIGEDEKTEYINANYVRGPKDLSNFYIATQGPMETTIVDFWRMVWEQNSRVIVMATDLVENGIEKCAEYLPPSVTLDNHITHGDFQITLKQREVKEKYAVSSVQLTNVVTNSSREITHFWYKWPETGVPSDEKPVIDMLLEARAKAKEHSNDLENEEKKSSISHKSQGPMTFHCSNGTGRTGTLIACDIVLKTLDEPKRSVDIPQIIYCVRRGRASSIQTKEQYEYIYKVAAFYADKITTLNEQ